MGLEPHLTPPVLYSTHIHTCSADAAWSARGLRQATPTSAQRMHTLADTAGSAETRPEERSPVADRRWASTCTSDRDPQTHAQREGGAGPLGASLGRPPPRRVGRTHALNRRQKSLIEPANRLDTHRVEAEAQPESPRARSDQRRFQAALDASRACLRIALIRPGVGLRTEAQPWLSTLRAGKLGRPAIAGVAGGLGAR